MEEYFLHFEEASQCENAVVEVDEGVKEVGVDDDADEVVRCIDVVVNEQMVLLTMVTLEVEQSKVQ